MFDTDPGPGLPCAMAEYLKAYEHGLKNAEFHLACGDSLTAAGNFSLSLFSGAALGALGYAAHLLESHAGTPLILGTLAVALHLLVVSTLLVLKCLKADDAHPAHAEPKALLPQPGGPEFPWEEQIRYEIEHLTFRIAANRYRNEQVAKWLNRLRIAGVLAPVTFTLVFGALAGAQADEEPSAPATSSPAKSPGSGR